MGVLLVLRSVEDQLELGQIQGLRDEIADVLDIDAIAAANAKVDLNKSRFPSSAAGH